MLNLTPSFALLSANVRSLPAPSVGGTSRAEAKFLLVYSIDENLTLNLWDFIHYAKSTLLGTATFDMKKLPVDASYEGIISPLSRDGKVREELRYDGEFYPVLGSIEFPESSVGIAHLVIYQAKDFDQSKSFPAPSIPSQRFSSE